MTLVSDKKFQTVAMVVVGYYLLRQLKQAEIAERIGGAAAEAGALVNPSDRRNLIYRTVNAAPDIFDNGMNDDSWNLGGWIYDVTHPNQFPDIR